MSYMQSRNTGGSTFWFEFFQEPFSEGEQERQDYYSEIRASLRHCCLHFHSSLNPS